RHHWGDQPLPADALPTALSPGYIVDSDPEEDEEDPEEDPVDHRFGMFWVRTSSRAM
nr:hypothetical protein [Tanacetum cinerariifolium]